jgi:hypothetical protein
MITEFCFNPIPIRGLQLARMKKLSALLEKEFEALIPPHPLPITLCPKGLSRGSKLLPSQ